MPRFLQNHPWLGAKRILVTLALAGLVSSAQATGLGLEENPKPQSFGALPFYFEALGGQTSGEFSFLARGQACNFFVGSGEAVLVLSRPSTASRDSSRDPELIRGANARAMSATAQPLCPPAPDAPSRETRDLRFEFVGANAAARVAGADKLAGNANYYLGSDPARWRTAVPLFARACVSQIYPGVDLVYYGNDQQLEYDFIIAPKADPGRIAIRFTGADHVQVNTEGELVFTLGGITIRQPKPVVYQTVRGVRQPVAGRYVLDARQTVAFKLGEYDRELPLVIDPVLSYSTFYGGAGFETGRAVAVDSNGFVYVAGETTGGLPVGPGTRTNKYGGTGQFKGDGFVAKFDNSASRLIYVTYLGGSADDIGLSLAVDDSGNAYVTGWTDSTDFPTTNAFQPHLSGQPYFGLTTYPIDAFVTKLGPAGNLIYSTYLGGDWVDEGIGIAVDKTGAAFVAGYTESTNFPVRTDLSGTNFSNYGGFGDAFLTKLSPSGTTIVYSLYLGGTNVDTGNGVAVNADGLAYVTGHTRSTNFPVVANREISRFFQSTHAGGKDAFVTVIGPNRTNLVFSTFYGGSTDNSGFRIALDAASDIYVTGITTSDPNFPITPSLINPGGVFRSGDAAANWTASSAGLRSVGVSSLAIDPTNPARIYAGTWRGVARSEDGGANWITEIGLPNYTNKFPPGIELGQVLALAIDPVTPTTVYAGTSLGGVWKSLDAGKTWSLNTTGILSLSINTLIVDPQHPAIVYAGTPGGVYVSTNAAGAWNFVNSLGGIAVFRLAMSPNLPTILYAATASGVYRTIDGGGTWSALNNGLVSLVVRAIAIDPLATATLYVSTEAGVFKSANSGTSWTAMNAGLVPTNVSPLAIDPLTPSTLYVGATNGVYKSYDGGTNWALVTNGLTAPFVLSLAINPQSPATVYSGSSGKVFFGLEDAFVFKLGSNGYSAVFGGILDDEGWDLAVDAAGQVRVVGLTYSTNFPTQNTHGFLRDFNSGLSDAFVAELKADGSDFLQSAYFGGWSFDSGYGIALDPVGNTYIVGATVSTNFPTLSAGQFTLGGQSDAFLAKLLADSGPILQITPATSRVTLSWPLFWPEFIAETATELLAGSGWTRLATDPVPINGMFTLQVETTNPASYFRLRRTLGLP